MNLKERLDASMKEAMKARDSIRLGTIRLMRTAVKNREIEERRDLTDEEITAALSTLVKQRKESADVYRQNDRPELAEKEEEEIRIIQEFLPSQLDEEEIRRIIDEAVEETGAASVRDMGKVMKVVAARTVGRADNRKVSELVREKLSS